MITRILTIGGLIILFPHSSVSEKMPTPKEVEVNRLCRTSPARFIRLKYPARSTDLCSGYNVIEAHRALVMDGPVISL